MQGCGNLDFLSKPHHRPRPRLQLRPFARSNIPLQRCDHARHERVPIRERSCHAVVGQCDPRLRATRSISSRPRTISFRVSGTFIRTPIGARVTAPSPPKGTTSMNFSHSATWMSAGTSTETPAWSNASRSRSTRPVFTLSSSPNSINALPQCGGYGRVPR